jgi:hypothetical protein
MRGNLTMTGAASTAEISGYGPSQGINVSGTVGPGQTIKIPGGTLVVPSGTLVNQGTIRAVDSATSLTGNITTTGAGLLDIAVPLPQIPAQPPEVPFQKFKASGDLDATVGAGVSFQSNGKTVRGFDASFRVVCGFPFPESAPLETIHFDSIPATTILNGNSAVIQGSFEIAQQNGTSLPPTWITASIQGDNSNGYTVRVYERRAHCEGGTIFSARKSS